MPTAVTKAELTRRFLETFDPTAADTFWDSRVAGWGLRTRRSTDRSRWTWVLRYRVGGRGSAQPRLSKRFVDATPEQARKWADRERALRDSSEGQRAKALQAKALAEQERMTPDCARLWDEYWAGEGSRKRSSRYYDQLWRDHLKPVFGNRKVRDVTPADVERFKTGMAEKPGACNRSLALLGRLFALAVRWGYRPGCAPEHPVKGIVRYPENPSEFFYSEEELGRILWAADRDQNRGGGLALRMLAVTGARAGEVTRAHWGQLELLSDDGANWTVESTNTKSGRPNTRYLDPDLTARLQAWKPVALAMQARVHGPLWLFPQTPNPKLPMIRLQHVWKRVLKEAGVRQGRIHDLRHTAGTLGLRASGSLAAVQAQLGHATILTTRRYAHVMREGMVEMGTTLGSIGARATQAAAARATAGVAGLTSRTSEARHG
jgi:integrase